MSVETMGLTHLALAVRDVERSLRFYEQVFGARVGWRGGRSVQINTPGSNDVIVLEESTSEEVGRSAGVGHFGFRLVRPEDIEAAIAAVSEAGGKIEDHGEFEPGEPYVFFRDPDGYVVEVWYEKEPSSSG